MTILHKLQWRYATKKFDSEKEVSEEHITELLKAMNLTASSYGLQPYEFIVVKNQELQSQLGDASWGEQVPHASHVIVLAAKTSIDEDFIQSYINTIAEVRNVTHESLQGYKQMMIDGPGSWDSEKITLWAQKQCYIVLGTLLIAAADLKIDACPMEGFEADKYDEILGLAERGLRATVIVPVGYRSHEDEMQHAKKVRQNLDEIITLKYSK